MAEQYFGKYTGVVKENKDPKKLGHLQVSVPAIFPEDETVEAAPALPFGYFFVPEKGAKVYVEFEGGDSGYPLWTAVQYIQGEWAAEAEADPPQLRVVKTVAGHLLIFDDKENKVELRDGANGHSVVLDASGIAIKDGANGHSVTLAAGKVTVEAAAGATLELKAGTSKVDLAPGQVTVDAGPGQVNVSGATVTVSGGLVRLGAGGAPVLHAGDMGIGNLGAPVVPIPTQFTVLA